MRGALARLVSVRAVVADDDEDLLEVLALELEYLGFSPVVRTRSGAGLVQEVRTHGPFDIIVTDINMPWMNGLDVTRFMRGAGVNTPVLIITGLETPATLGLGGDVAVLRKPFEAAALRDALRKLVPAMGPAPAP
jgi:two-component system response regulator YesN